MKKHSIFLVFLLGVLLPLLSSCSTTQTFTVRGVPGTVISKDNMQIAVIDQTGQAQIKTDRESGYQQFYLAKAPNSNLQVPFALDYVNHSRENSIYASRFTGGYFTTAGCLSIIIGAAISKDKHSEKTGLNIILLGVGVGLASIPFYSSYSKDPIDYNYDYLQLQTTNNDLIR